MKARADFKKISIHEAPEQSPGFLLWHVSTKWRGSIESTLKAIDLTHPQFVILATLGWLTRHGDRVTQANVSKMSGLDPNTVSQIIKGLEKKHLIVREPSLDRRAKNPLLTKKGSEILSRAIPAVETKDMEFFKKLDHEEQEFMLTIFKKLIADE